MAQCAVPIRKIISLSERIVHIDEEEVERATRGRVAPRRQYHPPSYWDDGTWKHEGMYGQECDPSTYLFQVSVDNVPRFHFVLRCASSHSEWEVLWASSRLRAFLVAGVALLGR